MFAAFILLFVGLIKRVAAIGWTARRMRRKVGEKRGEKGSGAEPSPSGVSVGKVRYFFDS